jgi:rubredoxin
MSSVEDYNGTCPKCGFDRMLVRYGSSGWFLFDACSKCGFAYGTAQGYNGIDEYKSEEVWESIIDAYTMQLKRLNLPPSREGIHTMVMSWDDPGERMGSVFIHEEFDADKRE